MPGVPVGTSSTRLSWSLGAQMIWLKKEGDDAGESLIDGTLLDTVAAQGVDLRLACTPPFYWQLYAEGK